MFETPPATDPPRNFLSRLLWPGLIFVMLGGQLLLMGLLVYVATSDGSFAVEPDYYQKGLNWDATLAQRTQNARLGWTAALEIDSAAESGGDREIRCRLTDKTGRPLDGATLDLVAFPHVRGNERLSVTLLPAGDGTYRSNVPLAHRGVWEFRLVIHRGPDTFTDTQLLDVAPVGGAAWQP